MGHFDKVHPPTKLERFVGTYFEQWLEYAREEQKRQRDTEDSLAVLGTGFGKLAEGAWEQWIGYLEDQILPVDDNERQLNEEE